eukprot:scaffold290782_cov33-Prasinocladus_malaysianus.AAC.1
MRSGGTSAVARRHAYNPAAIGGCLANETLHQQARTSENDASNPTTDSQAGPEPNVEKGRASQAEDETCLKAQEGGETDRAPPIQANNRPDEDGNREAAVLPAQARQVPNNLQANPNSKPEGVRMGHKAVTATNGSLRKHGVQPQAERAGQPSDAMIASHSEPKQDDAI